MSEVVEDLENDTLTYPQWVKRGSVMVNRDYLEYDDPDQTYNFLKTYGIIPEKYGIEHPLARRFKDMSRFELIDLILGLERDLHSYVRAFG